MNNLILKKLAEGDLRTTGRVDEVVAQVKDDPDLISVLIEGLEHESPGVRMRSADALEKSTRSHPEWLTEHKDRLVAVFTRAKQQEVLWHLAQILPRLSLSEREKVQLLEKLRDNYETAKSSILKTFTLQAMVDLTLDYPEKRQEVKKLVEEAAVEGTPALKSRARKLLKLFQ